MLWSDSCQGGTGVSVHLTLTCW